MVRAEVVCDEEFPVYRIRRMPSGCKNYIDAATLAEFDRVSNEWAVLQMKLKQIYIDQENFNAE